MSEVKKISVKKVARFAVGTLLVVVFGIALVAAAMQQNNKPIKALDIHLNDENNYSFLQKKDIEQLLLTNRSIKLSQTSIEKLDLKLMERIASTNPWVARAEVFVDSRQILQVNITQREPVCRIFDVNGRSYYMDSSLNTMPVSQGYSFPAPVFTNVPMQRNDSVNKVLKSEIAYLSRTIAKDSFWNAQITQVEMKPDHSFVLIPLFGNQRILLGDTSNVTQKLEHLFAFYKNVSGKIGWDKYEILDVRFKGQVVASPSIGWSPPKINDTVSLAMVPSSVPSPEHKPATKPAEVRAKTIAPVVAKSKVPVKPLPARVLEKQKPAAKVKATAQATKGKDKKEVKKDKENKTKAQSPKYIYPGKHSGNH